MHGFDDGGVIVPDRGAHLARGEIEVLAAVTILDHRAFRRPEQVGEDVAAIPDQKFLGCFPKCLAHCHLPDRDLPTYDAHDTTRTGLIVRWAIAIKIEKLAAGAIEITSCRRPIQIAAALESAVASHA